MENLHCVKFCVNCQKIPLTWIFYTNAGSDYYEVWTLVWKLSTDIFVIGFTSNPIVFPSPSPSPGKRFEEKSQESGEVRKLAQNSFYGAVIQFIVKKRFLRFQTAGFPIGVPNYCNFFRILRKWSLRNSVVKTNHKCDY